MSTNDGGVPEPWASDIAALRASHERLRAALENLEPWWGGHAGQGHACPICSAIREAREALAAATQLLPPLPQHPETPNGT